MLRRCCSLLGRDLTLHEYKGILLQGLLTKARGAPPPSTVVIDVREPAELVAEGSVPTALNLPLSGLAHELGATDDYFQRKHGLKQALSPEYNHLVFMCKGGVRSRKAMLLAEAAGFKADHYPGGFNGYSADPLSDAEIQVYLNQASKNSKAPEEK